MAINYTSLRDKKPDPNRYKEHSSNFYSLVYRGYEDALPTVFEILDRHLAICRHFTGGSTGSEAMVNRSQTGACVATATIKDKYGNVLGRGSSTFQVTIFRQQLDTALNGDKNQKQAKKLLQQARTQWSKDDVDRAIATLQEAKNLDPNNQEIVKTLKSMERQKEKLETKPGSQDSFQSLGQEGAPDSGQQGGSSERRRKIPKGHSTKYGF